MYSNTWVYREKKDPVIYIVKYGYQKKKKKKKKLSDI